MLLQLGKAQKPSLTDTSYRSWTNVSLGTLSPDGKYATYYIQNQPRNGGTLVVTATDKSWKQAYTNLQNTRFTDDSRYLLGVLSGDTLIRLKLQTGEITRISTVSNYQTFIQHDREWLVYKKKDSLKTLVIENQATGKVIALPGVEMYILHKGLPAIFAKVKSGSDGREQLCFLNLRTGDPDYFFTGVGTSDYLFDDSGTRLAFIISDTGIKKIMYYEAKQKSLIELPVHLNQAEADSFQVSTGTIWKFTSDSKRLLFTLELFPSKKKEQSGNVTVWSYKDRYLQRYYKNTIKGREDLGKNLTALEVESGKTIRLLSGEQKIEPFYDVTDILVVMSSTGDRAEAPWNKKLHNSYFICFPKTGRIDTVLLNLPFYIREMKISPDKRYLIYFDERTGQYYSYDTRSKRSYVISKGITESLFNYRMQFRGPLSGVLGGIAGWVLDKNRVVIQGMSGLWSVDPSNESPTVKLTDKCDVDTSLIFSMQSRDVTFVEDQDIIVTGYNIVSKETILYYINYKRKTSRKLFQTSNYLDDPYFYPGLRFQKARKANRFLFLTEHASISSNYIFTDSFQSFDTLSNVYPEIAYNWLTSEIIRYNDKYGQACEAVLYKPEDFDKKKKYPVILNYYVDKTQRFNKYFAPEPDGDGINIPFLVSNGYLVVKPNIYAEPGRPGSAALTSVLAVTDYLSQYHWVDSAKIGITGHSFGGYETNYIVTHTDRFAAAVSGAGITNIIDGVTGTWGDGYPSFGYYIKGPFSLVKSLEEDSGIYVENSPILSTSHMNTPLLLIHNEGDQQVPVFQGEQFFTQLRREGKPVWLLQYEGERHTIDMAENRLDVQSKILSFFNYYLKGMPQPHWLTKHN